ncbi:MAG TPA: urease accessory protein UreF [Candidatus Acidoferrales bacterium]|jgi:urease accessory protein|nr:urease accessory protein UreF [Candidatus Acidoferrales bacterium]
MDKFLSLLQFSDGLFPAGAYAHSFGLEACVQAGEVSDANGVESFLRGYLEGCAAPTDVVAVLCAWRAAKTGSLNSCLSLDERLDAMKTPSELRDASRQMGRQTLRVATHLPCHSLLEEFAKSVAEENTPGHHAVIFGIIGGVLDWDAMDMTGAYLYSTSAVLVGAALRLLPLGQLAGQRILWNVRPLIATLAAEAQSKTETDMWSFAPALEVASMRHALLDARLFRS